MTIGEKQMKLQEEENTSPLWSLYSEVVPGDSLYNISFNSEEACKLTESTDENNKTAAFANAQRNISSSQDPNT